MSAEETPGRCFRALKPEVEPAIGFQMVCAVQPTTPAEFPRAAGVGGEAVVADLYRVLGLEDLHGHILKAAVDVVDQPVLSITGGKAAPAPRIRLNREER